MATGLRWSMPIAPKQTSVNHLLKTDVLNAIDTVIGLETVKKVVPSVNLIFTTLLLPIPKINKKANNMNGKKEKTKYPCL